MDIKSHENCLTITSDSSEDGISNEDVDDDDDRGLIKLSPMPPVATGDESGDECFFLTPEDAGSYSPHGLSNISSTGSSYSPHSHTSSMYSSYEPSIHDHPPSFKRKADHADSGYGSIDDTASTVSSSSSGSNNKKRSKKYNFDSCAKEVEQNSIFAPKAQNMMKKMGFTEGKGLGRHQQGITAPIEASKQRGRSGIGHNVKQLEPAKLVWDDSYEEVSVEEVPIWLEGDHLPPLTHSELRDWRKEGPKIMEMDSYTDFCDPELLNDILENKSIFDNLQDQELLIAVKRSNPFESIGSGIFLNRAAMKMANLDRVFDYMFTNPLDHNNKPVVGEMDLLYFADVCAGPGGFSEYVLWRKSWLAKGIGFTLKNECDFKLEKFLAGTPETFEPFYGVKGNGDVFDPDNIDSLTDFVMAKTDNIGVHFMMADGGFSVSGQENIQEIMSKQLYLCQLLVALCIIRTGGHFVCKLFDVFTPFSVGLIYLMYRSFHKICLHKPNSSRPANSERYIICKYKRSDCEDIRAYMFNLNVHLSNLGSNSNMDISECVPMAELLSDTHFFDYIVNSNNLLGRRQLVHLKKVIAFCRDLSLTETKQSELKSKCLDYWGVPSIARKPDNTSVESLAEQILKRKNYDFATEPGEELTSEENLKLQFPSILDWTCIPVGNHNECHFYIGCRNRVYMLRKNGKGWTTLDRKVKLELSPGTLVYGEIAQEVKGKSRAQTREKFFHIIDAFQLGQKNIMTRSYPTRLRFCKLYAKALHKNWRVHASTNNYNSCSSLVYPMNLRANDYFDLKHIMTIFEKLHMVPNKSRDLEIVIGLKDELPRLVSNTEDDIFSDIYLFPLKGVLFYKITKDPWTVHFSKSRGSIYYYQKGVPSDFNRPTDINSSTIDCFVTRKLWTWVEGVGIKRESPKENVLHKNQIVSFVESAMDKYSK